jgi:hypothetical protein
MRETEVRRDLLGGLRDLNREQQKTGRIENFDVEAFAEDHDMDPEQIRDLLTDMIGEGLVEPFAESLGNRARDGACRITSEGMRELRGA